MIDKKPRIAEGTLWLLGLAAAVIITVLIVTRFESAMAEVDKSSEALRSAALPVSMYVHADPELEKTKIQLVDELRPLLRVRSAPSMSVSDFLRAVDDEAVRNNVVVKAMIGDRIVASVQTPAPQRAIAPPPRLVPGGVVGGSTLALAAVRQGLVAGRPTIAVSPIDKAFTILPFSLDLRGSYKDILKVIARLSTGPILAKVDDIDIGPGQETTLDGRLVSHVKVLIYHPTADIDTVGMNSRGIP